MGWLNWLDTTASDAFAREIAEEFLHAVPPGSPRPNPREDEQRLARAITVIGNRAAKFQAGHALGWYRKSRFMKTIENALIERGHSADLAKQVVYAVVLRTSR